MQNKAVVGRCEFTAISGYFSETVVEQSIAMVSQLLFYVVDWIGLSSVLRPRQHSIGYIGDGFPGQKTQPSVTKYGRHK